MHCVTYTRFIKNMDDELTLQQIFSSSKFADEGFDRPRWCGKESCYTTLQKWKSSIDNSGCSSDLTSTTASASSSANTTAYEIIWHDESTGEFKTLVSISQLMVPSATGDKPLLIEDYSLSADKSKVLLFTDAQKVWRLKTRGSYWILDLIPTEGLPQLRRLGGSNSDLMFATFSPVDSSKVAYVRNHNIYLENVDTNVICSLTTDGSNDIINGTFDWVYEEEFQMRNGFRSVSLPTLSFV